MRRYDDIKLPDGMQGWVIHWEPDEDTGWHDHGDSEAMILVVQGVYCEYAQLDIHTPLLTHAGGVARVSAGEIHRVMPNESAVCIHIYSPALELMTLYNDRGEINGQQSGENELSVWRKRD